LYLDIRNLKAEYNKGQVVLNDISLSVEKGEIVSLIGPSGSGKSTILRVLVGLLRPLSGLIIFNGNTVNYGNKKAVKELRDHFAIVFQQYNLFQNMNVIGNVTVAPIKVKKRKTAQVKEEAIEILGKVGLGDFLKAYPDELSGGQQQRVAIARALALHPDILLLDEITSALDPELVSEVLDTIGLLAKEGMTMIIVSHEMGFVREVSTKVAFLAEGCIVEIDSPKNIFDKAKTDRTQEFMSKILRQ